MDQRYKDEETNTIFSSLSKLSLWQMTELAAIKARVKLKMVEKNVFLKIKSILSKMPIDIDWWMKKDHEIHHDLNAFVFERLRYLPAEFHRYFHDLLTSYDDEEPAFARMLRKALIKVKKMYAELDALLVSMAIKYRHTIMNGRTHGQEAEMQTFGARILTWLTELRVAYQRLEEAEKYLKYSKLSGAIGKYGSINPEIEKEALKILGFKPFYGATQIMPRIVYVALGQSLCGMIMVISKIGLDIRLSARSGRPLMQEPFKKKQTGSTAMPHKKNTIRTEQLEGLARMAKGYMLMITDNIVTWEERAIEQSCVERVAWPDLFHTTIQSLKVITGVLNGLAVYPDNMLEEIYFSRGVYASAEIKEFLKRNLSNSGLTHENIYRIVQLASFNVFEPFPERMKIRTKIASSFEEAKNLLGKIKEIIKTESDVISIEEFIPKGILRVSEQLDIDEELVKKYNTALYELFHVDSVNFKKDVMEEWHALFTPAFLLKNESVLYKEIIGQ